MSSNYSIKKLRQDFKSKGVFYTPPELSEFMKKLIDIEFTSVYDPTCGRGNLLSSLPKEIVKFGQDIDEEAVEFCMENIENFIGFSGDTLISDKFKGSKFDVILANPPFSIKYDVSKVKLEDERYKDLPCLPPQSKADWLFMKHIISKLTDNGMAIVLAFPGILYRGNKEYEIRKYFVENNWIDKIISIPGKKFTDTSIGTVMIVMRKNKSNDEIKFIDLENEIEKTVSKSEIIENGYSLQVNSYCVLEKVKEEIDPYKLELDARKEFLRKLKYEIEFSKKVAELEGWEVESFLHDIKKVVFCEVL